MDYSIAMSRGDVIGMLAKNLILKRYMGQTLMGFIVYRGIPNLGRIVASVTDSMNEVHFVDLDDNDTMVYFMMVAGVDAQDLIGKGLPNTPDTIVYEMARLVYNLRKKIDAVS